ncbi:MAG: hypothetical protein R3F65_04045 [bacterium]|nr:hypothetical protein [Myxococcales bacterium]MCB9551278.1 hypothetical protein [Myxococcales bacterium]
MLGLCLTLLLAAGCDEGNEAPIIDAARVIDGDIADAPPLPDAGPDPADDGLDVDAAPEPPPEPTLRPATCGTATRAVIGPEGGALTVGEAGGALIDAAVEIGPRALLEPRTITLDCADADIVTGGFVPLGHPIRVTAETPARFGYGNWARVTLVFSGGDVPAGLESRHLRLYWRPDDGDRVAEPPMVNPEIDLIAGTVAFDTPGLGVFQLGHDPDAGQLAPRRFAYRAIAGISMGAGAAAYLGTRHHEDFDFIIPLGGAVDWPYMLHYITGRLTGGFCRHDEGDGLGAWCPPPPSTQQFEHESHYLFWYYSNSGGRFDRSEYGKLFQDMSFAYGNPLSYNPDSPYLPPGVPFEELLRPAAERCAAECRGPDCPPPQTFTIPRGFYDDEYNPEGELPVILFCDGEDGEPYGKFDGRVPHDEPSEIVFAVDLDGNGRRDTYEPVIRNMYEPFDDVGCDGVPSTEEPGYDPILRPDPAGDDYDWYENPLGTEGNWMYDTYEACAGDGAEPYRDHGLDGVPGTPQLADGGYDHGEGNGQFDYNPNYARFLERTGGLIYQRLSPDERARLRVWTDGGIRDLFNFATAGNHWMGRLQAGGQNVRIYDDFPRIMPPGVVGPYLPNPRTHDPFGQLGQSVFIRYGDPHATDEEVLQTNNGEHVGTTNEALSRFMSMYDWVHNRWEHLDYPPLSSGFGSQSETVFFQSERFGKTYRYAITTPPGYGDPANADERYPVVLLLHGYGQAPEDLPGTGALIADPMIRGMWARSIIVSPDGSCGRTERFECNDGVDNDRDGRVDAGNDAEQRIPCADDADCRGDYTCRPQTWPLAGKGPRYCCPPEFADCGPPDETCGLQRRGRTESVRVPLCRDGIDNDQDGRTDLDDEGCMGLPDLDDESDCREGSFYTTHLARKDGRPGGPDWEGALLDMLDHIDANYRTRPPEVVMVPK